MPPAVVVSGSEGAMQFGALLKKIRHRNELEAKDMARQAGVSVSFVSMIEKGERAPSMVVARAFFSCMANQNFVRWGQDGETLYLSDPDTTMEFAFTFTHRGQGRGEDKTKQERVPTTLVRDEHIRLECIKAAARVSPGVHSSVTIRIAQEYEAYVKTGKPKPEEA